jgi:hypothetical protein
MASDAEQKRHGFFSTLRQRNYHSRWDNREYADEEEGPELQASMQGITLKRDGPRPLDLSVLIDLGPHLERRPRQGRLSLSINKRAIGEMTKIFADDRSASVLPTIRNFCLPRVSSSTRATMVPKFDGIWNAPLTVDSLHVGN